MSDRVMVIMLVSCFAVALVIDWMGKVGALAFGVGVVVAACLVSRLWGRWLDRRFARRVSRVGGRVAR